MTVVADTTATQPDPTRGVVPAKEISIPVSVNNTFSATGKRVELTKATGTVRFENLDPTSTNRIPGGSVVRTPSGVRFRTQATITVPRAELVGLTIFPARASVKVTAVDGGPDGNVEAGTITIVPSGENSFFLKVTNPEPTAGGTSTEFSRVTQADVDGALAALNLSLQQAFQEAMADPSLETDGSTVFPSTGQLGEATPSVAPDTLVGQEVTTFELGLSADGTVIAVDEGPVSSLAEPKIQAAVSPGHELVPGSTKVDVGEAIITGQTVSFPVQATAEQIAVLDPEKLKAMVLGKRIDEARAILAPFGQVALSVSPDWTGSVPSFDSRVTLTIDRAVPIETPGASAPASSLTRRDAAGDQPSGELDPVTRLLGIDLGERRIGLALADDDGSAARPLSTAASRARPGCRRRKPWPRSSRRRGSMPWSSVCRSRHRATRVPWPSRRAPGATRSASGSIFRYRSATSA